jgi:hypothetical protein
MTDATARNVLQFLKPGEVALAKNGLRSIAEGLGISIHLEYPSAGGCDPLLAREGDRGLSRARRRVGATRSQ